MTLAGIVILPSHALADDSAGIRVLFGNPVKLGFEEALNKQHEEHPLDDIGGDGKDAVQHIEGVARTA